MCAALDIDSSTISSLSTSTSTTSTETQEDRWQRHITSVNEGVAHLYKTKEFADVTFIVDGCEFKAHRLFVAARSPELAKIIESENCKCYVLTDVTSKGFELLLKYIYIDKLETTDKQEILKVSSAASLYKVKVLESKCKELISKWEINCKNVCSLLSLAQENKVETLKNRCLEFIYNNGVNLLKSNEFLEANLDTIEEMLKSGKLNQVPLEIKINCIMNWAVQQFPKEIVNFRPVRETMSPLLQYLDLTKLPLEKVRDFGRKYPGYFSDTEIAKIVLGEELDWN